MMLVKAMPVKSIADLVKEHNTRILRVLHHYADESRQDVDFFTVTAVGVDETCSKRGHNYVSLFVDMKSSQALFATEGKDASTLDRFKTDLEEHQGDPSYIQEICCDTSPVFISGVKKRFPEAQLTFDKFHVLKIINEAVNEVCRQEQQDRLELKRTRNLWLKNPSKSQRESGSNPGCSPSKEAESQNGPGLPHPLELPRALEQRLQEVETFRSGTSGRPQPAHGTHQRGRLHH